MRLLLSCCLMVAIILLNFSNIECNDSPGFFLKMAKNIPRLGRRSDREYENYFMKSAKAIPRIGRSEPKDDLLNWLTTTPQQPAAVSKRMLPTPSNALSEYSVVQPVNTGTLMDLIQKDAIPSENVKFVHWKDFDRALLLDNDLYEKVVSLGRRPDRNLQHELSLTSHRGNYVPVFGNGNNDGGADFMLYNRGDNDQYPTGAYGGNYLSYNNLK